MGKTNLYQAAGTPYQLEELPTGSERYIIWDTRLEAAREALALIEATTEKGENNE